MADDMSSKVMELLNNPDMMKRLSDALGGTSVQNSGVSPSGGGDNAVLAENAKTMLNAISHTDDRRITLLNAIRPYMSQNRARGIDRAVKLLQISKLTEIFKDQIL